MSESMDVDPRKVVAEVVGTFVLIFIAVGSIIASGQDTLAVALAYGLAFALLLSALGHVSAGLFNPALTLGLWVTRRMDSPNAIAYIIAQLVGAVLAALALGALTPESIRGTADIVPELRGVTVTQGVGIEIILTAFLMLAVFGTTLDPRGPKLGGFGIGLVLTVDVLAAYRFTGAAMNPARAFGPALLDNTWDDQLVYWIGPVIGAVLAALVYHYLFAEAEAGAPAV
jgi:MIP family channel proteins